MEDRVRDLTDKGQDSFQRATLDEIAAKNNEAARSATRSVNHISKITSQMKMLALNAKIESAKAGSFGRGFSVVADEVGLVGEEINSIAREIQSDLSRRLSELNDLVAMMDRETTGERLVDLAFSVIDTMDRNLYERTCDVRWWATEPSFCEAATLQDAATIDRASARLSEILGSYNIYLDLWICDTNGQIIANGRPETFRVVGASVADLPWFRSAVEPSQEGEYVAGNVVHSKYMNDRQVISYAAAIREGGRPDGKVVGVLSTCFDWEAQARSVVTGMRVDPRMAAKGLRLMIVDQSGRVIGASDGVGLLTERLTLPAGSDPKSGVFRTADKLIGYHQTEGFETYRGLGWKGVAMQDLS